MGGSKKGKGQSSGRNSSSAAKQQQGKLDDDHLNQVLKELQQEQQQSSLQNPSLLWSQVGAVLVALISLLVGVSFSTSIWIPYRGGVGTLEKEAFVYRREVKHLFSKWGQKPSPDTTPGKLVNRKVGVTRIFDIVPLDDRDSDQMEYGNVFMFEPNIVPTMCSDGRTKGFSDWSTLQAAIREANHLAADRYFRWQNYFGKELKKDEIYAFTDDTMYYQEEWLFTICPHATLRGTGPLFLNAENMAIECWQCRMELQRGGSHLTFGPHAKRALIRGVTFTGATTSSVTFYYDGADAIFEECQWTNNIGRSPQHGAVADVNSTR